MQGALAGAAAEEPRRQAPLVPLVGQPAVSFHAVCRRPRHSGSPVAISSCAASRDQRAWPGGWLQSEQGPSMLRIGFLGAGKMAQAMARGFLAAGITKGDNIIASCAPWDIDSIEAFKSLGASATTNNIEPVQKSNIIFLAVKPVVVPTVLKDISSAISDKHLLLSVAMGVQIQDIEQNLPSGSKVMRVMPNTPALVGSAASVYTRGTSTTSEDVATTQKLLEAIGTCDEVPESMLDPITALSGSGPAYIYVIIEALADGGVKMGLPRDLAYRLAAQTVVGAGRMVIETRQHPGQLKDNVTSPAGSTAEGLYFLEQQNVRAALIGAVEVATQRCKEMNNSIQRSL